MGRKFSFWKIVAVVIFVLALYATWIRFSQGLGAATNLNDTFPWGIWIGFDILVGVGLAAGGFVIAATVHIFNMEDYEPISRSVVLTAFLGYLLVVLALLFDLGRPWNIWHPLIMWNPHSVMFEVAWCVTLYTTVLALEFSPIVLEKFNLEVPLKFVRTLYLPIVVAGVLLSILHQSSLGTLYVLVPDKLHHLWYSPLLPVFFFITAIGAGLAMTIIESFLSYRAFGKRLEHELLTGLARVIVVALAVYVTLKFQDLFIRDNLHLAFEMSRESVMFWVEMGLGAILPMCLLFSYRIRERPDGLFFSALLVVMGFIVNRLNVSITGMLHSETYFPKWTELAITLGLVTLGFTIFAYGVKYFSVFPEEELKETAGRPSAPEQRSRTVFSSNVILAICAVLIIATGTYGLAVYYQQNKDQKTGGPLTVARAAEPRKQELNLPDEVTFPAKKAGSRAVTFSHKKHISFQEKPDCTTCHTGTFGILKDEKVAPQPTSKGGMFMHKKQACGKCHNGEDAFSVLVECTRCHGNK